MTRLFKLAALALPLVVFSCSSPVPSQPNDDEEDLGTAVSALDEGVIEPFMTTSFDIATRTLAGYDGDLNPYTGRFVATSRLLRANLTVFIPGDPCRELAADYNAARIVGGDAVWAAISNYVGCNARVRLSNTGEIRSFSPIPDQPPPPPPPPPDDDCDDDQHACPSKITICHIPPGNPGARHTIVVGASAWAAHKGHGDYKGVCR